MNLGELHRLGRHLEDLASEAMREGAPSKLNRAQRAIQSDIRENPDTSVGEIAARTGFSQGYVSTAIADLREMGRLETRRDPSEGRRTLVRLTEATTSRIEELRRRMSVEELLTDLQPDIEPDRIPHIVEVLKDLDQRLTERALNKPSSGRKHP
ncbi:MarR family winged helix-turn-helix transcriptional regulator [Streptomyces sp. NPDC050145]|uniref:MarR family winged helix-turn-helix transcriptional regulator n=1 Tax=Streptomyces sp. NPDC050145 TaxID=3365602 RepID=UPI00378FBC15